MMTQEQAAKYFIVAWVKDWSLRMYLSVVCGKENYSFDEAHKNYQWLPSDAGFFMRNVRVRRYIGDQFRVLNDKLWDAADNEKRLALHVVVASCNANGAKQGTDKSRLADKKQGKKYRADALSYRLSVETMRRGNGSHWNVVK